MAQKHIIEAAHAVRRLGSRAAKGQPKTRRAIVVKKSPVQVELVGGRATLSEDDLTLSHAVRLYDHDFGIAVGDSLLVHQTDDGDFVATAVIAAANSQRGMVRTVTATPGEFIGGGAVTGGGGGTVQGTPLVGKLAWKDDEGVIVGYVPLI